MLVSKNMFNSRGKIQAFSLVEVLVFVAVIAIFFIVASAVTVAILRNMKINEHKIIATRYAEEAIEWLKNEKETDWKTFTTNAAICASNQCFYNLDWSGRCISCNKIDEIYSRTVDFQPVSSSVINVTVKVSWSEIGNTYTVPIQSTFSFFD